MVAMAIQKYPAETRPDATMPVPPDSSPGMDRVPGVITNLENTGHPATGVHLYEGSMDQEEGIVAAHRPGRSPS